MTYRFKYDMKLKKKKNLLEESVGIMLFDIGLKNIF